MAYTTINKSSEHFNTVTYSGNGSNARGITGVGFQPDWTWIKNRNATEDHNVYDAVRGATKSLVTNTNGAEATYTTVLQSFDTDGFTVGTSGWVNDSGKTYASWNWKANGSGSSNSDGNVTATVSANTTAGFSIVSWTSNGQEQSIGHGLGATPSMIIMKTRNTGDGWIVGHKDNGWDYYQVLQGTNAKISDDRMFSPSGGSDPTNSLWWTNSTAWVTGGTTECIAYCFAEKTGYSKFGSYTGNGSTDGTFVYTGFKPAFLIVKRTSGADGWIMYDTTRETGNVHNLAFNANSNSAEDDQSAYNTIDIVSNGFKCRGGSSGSGTGTNQSGGSYIYMAFGQSLVGSNNIPCTAR
jgi:hypothetical protein